MCVWWWWWWCVCVGGQFQFTYIFLPAAHLHFQMGHPKLTAKTNL